MSSAVSLQEQSIRSAPTSPGRPRTRTASSSTGLAWLTTLKPSRSTPDLQKPPPQSDLPPVPSLPPSRVDSSLSRRSSDLHKERAISVLYTPHGVSTRTLEPYITHHLTSLSALPVSALFHSINVEENPWFMGGIVARGAPGGAQIAKRVSAQHWISAHDELKDNRGMATMWIKSRRYEVEEVWDMLRQGGLARTKVHSLGVGEILRVPEVKSRDDDKRSLYEAYRLNVEDIPPVPPMPDLKALVESATGAKKKELAKFWADFAERSKG